MNPSGMSTELDIKVPIIIGTVPLREVVTTFFRPATSLPYPAGFAPTAPSVEEDKPPDYSELSELRKFFSLSTKMVIFRVKLQSVYWVGFRLTDKYSHRTHLLFVNTIFAKITNFVE